MGNLVLDGAAVDKILVEGGYIDSRGRYHFLLTDHRGDVRADALADGTVESEYGYAPYGESMAPVSASEVEAQPYRFSGNELDRFGWYDFTARQYSPVTGRFSTPDPLSEDYYSISPYAYCAGDPINLVDPFGMDYWKIDKNGYIKRVQASEDYLDRIYDEVETSYVSVNPEIPEKLSNLEGSFSIYTSTSNINDMFKLFLYAANNTDVEWGVYRVRNSYSLVTQHDKDGISFEYELIGGHPDASVHSHPNNNGDLTSPSKEKESMGYIYPDRAFGDWANVVIDRNNYGAKSNISYVYFPYSGNLYNVGIRNPIFIRKIHNDFRRFYFGTLNIK